jgi:hypothetical protein
MTASERLNWPLYLLSIVPRHPPLTNDLEGLQRCAADLRQRFAAAWRRDARLDGRVPAAVSTEITPTGRVCLRVLARLPESDPGWWAARTRGFADARKIGSAAELEEAYRLFPSAGL